MSSHQKHHKSWMRLDNAALIYPAVRKRDWMAMFRLTADLTEPVDKSVLEKALSLTINRFPSFRVRLRRGLFWFYLESIEDEPRVREDVANPCVRMDFSENNGYMFRVRYYKKRVSIEIFHVVADGTGGLSFFKTMLAEYIRIKYGEDTPRDYDVVDCSTPCDPEELEDAFHKYARRVAKPRNEPSAYSLAGTREERNLVHITTGIADSAAIMQAAKAKGVSITAYLTSVLIMALCEYQRGRDIPQMWRKPIKVNVPVNLRQYYPTITKRNFSQYVNPGIEPKFGEHTFDEVLNQVHHFLKLEINEKNMNARFSRNVMDAEMGVVRVVPLFLKNIILRMNFNVVGDNLTTSSMSNLGLVRLPDVMEKYIDRMDFIMGPLRRNPVVMAAGTYKDKMYINFTRTIKETDVERDFFRFLVRQGIGVMIESNNLPE